jgi:hypothetical protein
MDKSKALYIHGLLPINLCYRLDYDALYQFILRSDLLAVGYCVSFTWTLFPKLNFNANIKGV